MTNINNIEEDILWDPSDEERKFLGKKYREEKEAKRRKFSTDHQNDGPGPVSVPKKTYHVKDLINVSPITDNQEKFFDEYLSTEKHFVLAGSAGVGKSFLSLYLMLKDVLDGKYDKLIIVRSAVSVRSQGFLPGELNEKNAVFEVPYSGIFDQFFKWKKSYETLKEQGKVEFLTTSFIRGVTWDNAAIFVDEAKSMMFSELDSVITRVGENSRLIIAGDPNFQNDLETKKWEISGFNQFLEILCHIKSFTTVTFNHNDIVRSGLVKDYIIARDKIMAHKDDRF